MADDARFREIFFALEVPVRDTALAARLTLEWWMHVQERNEVSAGPVTLSDQEREMLTMMIEDLQRRTADMRTLMSGV